MSSAASHKLIELFLTGIFRILVVLGAVFIFFSLLSIWANEYMDFSDLFIYLIGLSSFIIGFNFILTRHQFHEIPPNTQEYAIQKLYAEFKFIVVTVLLINLTILLLSLLPLFIIQFNIINFTQPFSVILIWFYLTEGIFLCVLSYLLYTRKKNILAQVQVEKVPHESFKPTDIQRAELTQELKARGIVPEGAILTVFGEVGISTSTYALKRFRKWPWQEKGKIILTERELIFLSKTAHLVIPLAEINSIHSSTGRGGIRTYHVCEIIYASPKKSAIFYGHVSLWASDPPTELELKSMRLMESIQKWYDLWSQN